MELRPNINQTLSDAKSLAKEFENIADGIDYEEKGIFFSEMFFLFATVNRYAPEQLLESGRARGQSTLLLCRCFPATQIVSVEFNKDSPDVEVCEARLRNYTNVKLLFGDSLKLLPSIIKKGDFVLIDGPKGHRGLRLALKILSTRKASAVFVHDCYGGSLERDFLSKNYPTCFYSDHPEFVRQYSYLDQKRNSVLDEMIREYSKGSNYGPTLACIPFSESCNFTFLLFKLKLHAYMARIKRLLATSQRNDKT